MPGKAQMYAEVATETASRITGSFERWTGFLETAARLYKYPFHEQLMIYAQRPEATACASFETWNETMRMYVKRGSKGIALIDPETERLRYVFDVSDTGTRENSRRLYLWEFNENEHFDAVSKALEQKYDVSGKNGIAEQLEVIAAQLTDEFWNAHQRDILSSVEDSFLSDYDDFDVNVSFHNAATVSATYMLLSRCGLDPKEYFTPEDYLSVFDFNTPEAVYALGSAISETSEEILRTVETAVKNYERERRSERIEHHEHNIQPERGLSDSRPDGRTPDSSRQVRQNEEKLSQNPPPDTLEQDDTSRQAERASSGDRQLGEQPIGGNVDRDVSQSGSDREAESRESAKVDGYNEQLEVAGRGDNSQRDDLRLDEPSWEQISLFPTEEEQIRFIDEMPQEASAPPLPADYTLIREQHLDDVILYQVGDFFEMYGEDAEKAAEMLGLRLAHRTFGNERVPMCGIPSFKLEENVEKLRESFGVTISTVGEKGERSSYSLGKTEVEREQPAPDYTSETVAVYPAESNHLPFDVVVETLHFDEPQIDSQIEDSILGNSLYFQYFYDYQSEEADAYLAEHPDYHRLFGSDEQGLNGDTIVIYRHIDDLPAYLREYASKQLTREELEQDIHRGGTISIPVSGEWQEFPDLESAQRAAYEEYKADTHRNSQNFRITDDNLGVGGAKTKYQANINAIKLLKHLESEGLQAIPEQQEVLSRYVGWGGLADAFDSSKPNWANEYSELKSVLTTEEYESARASTLNAHYTSPTVIKAIYEAIGNMGFETGNILDIIMQILIQSRGKIKKCAFAV